jgi:hypothetical protein
MVRGEKSRFVSAIAEERGVHERTVWRWFAGLSEQELQKLLVSGRTCDHCGQGLPSSARINRRFCDDTCRVYGWRER